MQLGPWGKVCTLLLARVLVTRRVLASVRHVDEVILEKSSIYCDYIRPGTSRNEWYVVCRHHTCTSARQG